MMFKNITLRSALAISLSLHLLVSSPWNALRFGKIEDKEDQIEVTYILEELSKEAIEKQIENLPQKYGIEKKELQKSQKVKLSAAKIREEAHISEKEEQYLEDEKASQIEEYITYYELIREKIKKRVTRYYRKRGEEGSVDVIFALTREGRIKSLEIAEVKGRNRAYLEKIARKSIKSASPFPPFPKALHKNELTFTISIIFKKR